LSSPTQLASRLVERLGISGKPDLAEIAERIGLRIREIDADGFEGTLVRALEGSKGIIGVTRSIRERSRQRFTIAHEIGHYVLPEHRNLENVCESSAVESWRDGLRRPELEANEFAVELLLPEKLVRKALRLGDPSHQTIRAVAGDFETSLTATTCRFVSLTDLACAAVWSQNKRAIWYRRSAACNFYLPKEALPCEGSVAKRIFDGGDGLRDLAEVPVNAWLDRRDAEKVSRVLEHSFRIPSYDAVLTLLWFHVREPRGDDDDESPLHELDPDEFTVSRKRWPR
jgi:Zn-dependent peptidase ImmA (M78 family)